MLPGNSATHFASAARPVPPDPVAIVGMAFRFPGISPREAVDGGRPAFRPDSTASPRIGAGRLETLYPSGEHVEVQPWHH
jgi:hypothetical protein